MTTIVFPHVDEKKNQKEKGKKKDVCNSRLGLSIQIMVKEVR